MDILFTSLGGHPIWVWVVLAVVVLIILSRIATALGLVVPAGSPAKQRQGSKRPAKQGSKRQGYGRKETEQAGSPVKTHRTVADKQRQDSWDKMQIRLEENYDNVVIKLSNVADKQRQDSWDKRLEENYDVVVIKLSNCGWILVNERDSPDGTKIASFRRQDGLDLLVEKGMAGGMAGGVAGRKLNRGVISYSGTGKKEAEKDLDS